MKQKEALLNYLKRNSELVTGRIDRKCESRIKMVTFKGRQEAQANSELMLETSRGDNAKFRFQCCQYIIRICICAYMDATTTYTT